MKNLKKEILECNSLTFVDFLGEEKILLECPCCGSLTTFDSTPKKHLEHFLAVGLDVETYLCECINCMKNYYLYL